jgi:threonine dehydrogenase-like Zn-dependent dehydrogenase
MKAAILTEYGKIEWQEVPIPEIGQKEVLVKVGYTGICGTDMHIYSGEFHPRTKPPLIMGHEFGGTIARVGKSVKNYKQGDRVAVDPIFWCGKCSACKIGHYPACSTLKLIGVDVNGAFAEYVTVKDFMLYKTGTKISEKNASLIEVLSIGFHACKRAAVQQGDTIAIWGSGRIGQSILQAVRTITKNTIFMIDILDTKLEIAKKTYPEIITINSITQNPIKIIQDKTKGRGVDIAFEAVGHAQEIPDSPEPVRACIQSIRGAGTVCILGLSNQTTSLLMKELIFKEAKIVTSRVTHGEFKETIQHLKKGHLYPDNLITCEIHASKAQEIFQQLKTEPHKYLKVLFTLKT